MDSDRLNGPPKVGRRQLLMGGGAAAVAGSVGAVAFPRTAAAGGSHKEGRRGRRKKIKPIPSPILVETPTGLPPDQLLATIRWVLPGPTDRNTPFLGIPGFGLDAEPSTITNYKGFTAYGVTSGVLKRSDGKTLNVEFDVRVMDGYYKAEDGTFHRGTFGFF